MPYFGNIWMLGILAFDIDFLKEKIKKLNKETMYPLIYRAEWLLTVIVINLLVILLDNETFLHLFVLKKDGEIDLANNRRISLFQVFDMLQQLKNKLFFKVKTFKIHSCYLTRVNTGNLRIKMRQKSTSQLFDFSIGLI